MNSYNCIGRIGRDAVTRQAGDGTVTGFALAVDSGYGDKKQTLWFDCSGWGKRFEGVAPYLLKGSQVGVSGELGTREHEGKTYFTLRVADVTLVGPKQDSAAKPAQRQNPAKQPVPADDFADDDIPF